MSDNIDNTKNPIFLFEWPVYGRYDFMPLIKYAERLPLSERNEFHNTTARFFSVNSPSDDDLIVIVPDYDNLVRRYNPMEQGVNLFNEFANLYESSLSSDMVAIQAWLMRFGLPFSQPSFSGRMDYNELTTGFPYDALIGQNITFEGMLYKDFGEYVMMKSTLLLLVKEARNLLEDQYSIRGENRTEFLSDQDLAICAINFRLKMARYMDGISPVLVPAISDTSGVFDRSWRVSSLWTAMMAQFYDSIVENSPIRRCKACNNPLVATHGRTSYCQNPDWYQGFYSACKNRVNQKEWRKRQKEKKAAEEAAKRKEEAASVRE